LSVFQESSQELIAGTDPGASGDHRGGASGLPPQLPLGAEECFVNLDGARMRYLRQGSGPALVLIHGLLGYSFSWRFVMPVLAKRATVFAVDLLGAGFSDRPPNLDCRLRPSAERFLRFLDAVGIREFDLLGTSHGGAVAMMAASLLDERPALALHRMVLVAPVNPWSPHGRRLAPILGSPVGSRLFLAAVAGRPSMHKLALWRLYGNPANIPPGTLEGYAAPAVRPGFFEYGLKIAANWSEGLRDLSAAIPTISHYRTQLIWGARDRAVFVRSAEPLRRQFRDCELQIFPKAGHLPYEETPDQFNRVLIDFLYPG
jgi:pimeloyl-ACP methyl ester carboxylesterase